MISVGRKTQMYTGLVETTGEITDAIPVEDGYRLRVSTDTERLAANGSISVSGVCLTAEQVTAGEFESYLSSETVQRTYLTDLRPGATVNIEYPLTPNDQFGGHVVKGTVDTVTHLRDIELRAGSEERRLSFAIPQGYAPYLIEKGNVALDGISLTVASLNKSSFEVAVVPRTEEITTLSELQVGDPVHFEADLFAKYAGRRAELEAT